MGSAGDGAPHQTRPINALPFSGDTWSRWQVSSRLRATVNVLRDVMATFRHDPIGGLWVLASCSEVNEGGATAASYDVWCEVSRNTLT